MITPRWISPDDAEHQKYVIFFRQLTKEMDFVEALETCINLTMYALQSAHQEMRADLVRGVISELEQLETHLRKGERLNDHNVQ
jgi:hypothetical protein